jgi:hypothetical protein
MVGLCVPVLIVLLIVRWHFEGNSIGQRLSLLTEKCHLTISKRNLETVISYYLHVPKRRSPTYCLPVTKHN